MLAVTPRMEPAEGDAETDATIAIEIVVLHFIFDKHRIQYSTVYSYSC